MDFPIEMYKITPTTTKIKVTCQKCTGIGIVDDNCKYCGGKGTHYKTLAFWKIASKPVIIEKINRSKNGELRFIKLFCRRRKISPLYKRRCRKRMQ